MPVSCQKESHVGQIAGKKRKQKLKAENFHGQHGSDLKLKQEEASFSIDRILQLSYWG